MCCGKLWLAFKRFVVRILANRGKLQKSHLLYCRKCRGEDCVFFLPSVLNDTNAKGIVSLSTVPISSILILAIT